MKREGVSTRTSPPFHPPALLRRRSGLRFKFLSLGFKPQVIFVGFLKGLDILTLFYRASISYLTDCCGFLRIHARFYLMPALLPGFYINDWSSNMP